MLSIPSIIKKIFAHQPSYKSRLKSELGFYKEIKEVHELPKIFHYWSNKYLAPAMQQFGFTNPDDFFFKYISDVCTDNPEQTLTVLSLGSGNCDLEARLASNWMRLEYVISISVALILTRTCWPEAKIMRSR